jgi:hypothetical protein
MAAARRSPQGVAVTKRHHVWFERTSILRRLHCRMRTPTGSAESDALLELEAATAAPYCTHCMVEDD